MSDLEDQKRRDSIALPKITPKRDLPKIPQIAAWITSMMRSLWASWSPIRASLKTLEHHSSIIQSIIHQHYPWTNILQIILYHISNSINWIPQVCKKLDLSSWYLRTRHGSSQCCHDQHTCWTSDTYHKIMLFIVGKQVKEVSSFLCD